MEYYKILKDHYEKRLMEFGPNSRGMDWPNHEDLEKRFKVLTDMISFSETENQKRSLLDLGCGAGLLVDFLQQNDKIVNYYGVDISEKMIEVAKKLHPDCSFEVRDILIKPYNSAQFDYVIMNGLLTEKQSMSQFQMVEFAQNIILNSFNCCSEGIAFNIMSTHVDWKRDDLFHWELDGLVEFLVKNCSRKIKIMMDYGLFEYTVYLYK